LIFSCRCGIVLELRLYLLRSMIWQRQKMRDAIYPLLTGPPPPRSRITAAALGLAVLLVSVTLFAGCDALKSLYGEIYGEDDGSDGGGAGSGSEIGGGGGGVPVIFMDITVDGEETTTLVSLVFNRDIDGLSEDNVSITDAGSTGAVKGVLSPAGSAGIYTLAVSGVKETGEITIRVVKTGYTFNPASRMVQVYYDDDAVPVTFAGAIADGTPGSQTSTVLTLTFNQIIPDLNVNDITLATGSTGATKGVLFGPGSAGSGASYTLGLNDVAAAGEVTITISKSGYTVSPATIQVPVYYQMPGPATGGVITYEPVEGDSSLIWEIHTFTAVLDTFAFITPIGSVTADYLIVAGGGGSGGDKNAASGTNLSGGGGAGGLLYKTGATLSLTGGAVEVAVGEGGAGGAARKDGTAESRGKNGGDSSIGDVVVPGGGGGGGGNDSSNDYLAGLNGGSGGGGGAGSSANGAGGQRSSGNPDVLGYAGGYGAMDPGGGGGGAGGVGQNASMGGAGGAPWTVPADASWISTATGGTAVFSKGGNGGPGEEGGTPGANYGDGGSAGNNKQKPGAAGHSGIVVIRFQRPVVTP
jgi:hypothetical protein